MRFSYNKDKKTACQMKIMFFNEYTAPHKIAISQKTNYINPNENSFEK